MKPNQSLSRDLLAIVIGSLLYACAVSTIDSIYIVCGSTIGVSLICTHLFGVSAGLLNVLLNIPILMLCTIRLGKRCLVYTIIIILLTSGLSDFLLAHLLIPHVHELILTVISGIMMGIGSGLFLRCRGTLGGSTAIVQMLHERFPALHIGAALFIMDGIVILSGIAVYRRWDSVFYSILYQLILSFVMDLVFGWKQKSSASRL